MITASLNNYHQSPRKVRLVADLVRGKKVERALTSLQFLTKNAADPIRSVIEMAVSNAKNNSGVNKDRLFVKEISVDSGVTMKRFRPRARGSAYPIRKKSSRISVVLAEQELSV